ncbi:hypothetical protein [Streptomyces massasporeus]|uniref:hypothetical protein n=1 Tax=Streptomyces massasporeus TaxID=67324 RepID=UPI0033D73E66
MTGFDSDLVQLSGRLGVDRVISPAGALPQPAEVLDASGPVRPYEFEVEVHRLCLDATPCTAWPPRCAITSSSTDCISRKRS